MNIRKFGIYLADLNPRFGTEAGKTRPVVVVQTDLLNTTHPSTIICPITSQLIEGSRILRVKLADPVNGLVKESAILVDQIRAIDNRRFMEELGRLNQRQQQQLLENLKIVILE